MSSHRLRSASRCVPGLLVLGLGCGVDARAVSVGADAGAGASGASAGEGGSDPGQGGTSTQSSGAGGGGGSSGTIAGDTCEPSPCEHGTCSLVEGVAQCACETGYGGPTCATDIDECADTPCQNGGACSDGLGSYTCDCTQTAFAGPTCALERFQRLAFMTGAGVRVFPSGISDDASIVVGTATDFGALSASFRWTVGGGLEDLTPVLGTDISGASADGSVLIGTRPGTPQVPFRWTEAGGSITLPAPVGFPRCRAEAVSGDGSTVVGTCDGGAASTSTAVRWVGRAEPIPVEELPTTAAGVQNQAHGVSYDGTFVVGVDYSGGARAVLWTLGATATVQEGLGLLPDPGTYPTARAVSSDGVVVVGDDGTNAFRWTRASGVQLLPQPSPADPTLNVGAVAINPAGTVTVGHVIPGSGFTTDALIWDIGGARYLRERLIAAGVAASTFDGWVFGGASVISADGKTIAGGGLNPDGAGEAWIARLP